MDWSFTDEQKELRRTAKRFVDEELRPVADQIDKGHEIPRHIIEKMAELGFLGVVFPEEYDGVHVNFPHLLDSATTRGRPLLEIKYTPFADEITLQFARGPYELLGLAHRHAHCS